MIYDEGFDIKFNTKNADKNDRSYFVFSRYGENKYQNKTIKSKWVSYCYSTLIGWYHIGDDWGCFYGTKEGQDKDEITNGEAENKLNVVEGQIVAKDGDEKVHTPLSNSNLKNSSNLNPTQSDSNKPKSREVESEMTFLEEKIESKIRDQLNSLIKAHDHSLFVEQINNSNLLWKAHNYEKFSSMSFAQLNRYAGRIKYKGNSYFTKKFKFHNKNKFQNHMKSKHKFITNIQSDNKSDNFKEYPKNFSWLNIMSDARSQGDCGSCFAMATISMLEARIRKLYPSIVQEYFKNSKDLSISLKHALRCSVYNQGCDGGYAYLVMKFFNEFEMVLNQCYSKSTGCRKKCNEEKLNKLNFSVKDYKYIGGSYGKCSEDAIIKDVYENGPIVASLEPDYGFMFYKSGIYTGQNLTSEKESNQVKPEWEKVDHSMTLVGWGEEESNGKIIKYWILQNSWGTAWGENGYMKLLRGIDHLGIESICESAIPVVFEEQ